jgi:DNA-binding MarR family transcriptional regulator
MRTCVVLLDMAIPLYMTMPDQDDADFEALGEALRDLYSRAQRAMDVMMAEQGISFSRHKLLGFIRSRGPVRSTDISAHFGFAPRTVTEAVDVLERDGMVTREPDPSDRRAKWISITDAGEAVIASTEPMRRSFVRRVFGALDVGERRALLIMLKKLTDRI